MIRLKDEGRFLSMELFTLGEIEKKGHFFTSDVDKKERVDKFKTKHASGIYIRRVVLH